MLPTTHFVNDSQITKATRKIKDIRLVEILNNTIATYQHIIDSLGWRAEEMTCDEIVNFIKNERAKARPFTLLMAGYMLGHTGVKFATPSQLYKSCASAILRYTDGRDVNINDITAKWLEGFQYFLQRESTNRGTGKAGEVVVSDKVKMNSTIRQYMVYLRSAFNSAKREFNDEERGIIRIQGSPFSKYSFNPKIPIRKRSLTKDDLLKIWNWDGRSKLCQVAKGYFFISFFLMGCNLIDLHNMKNPVNGVLSYKRSKTRGRRTDEAYMEIRVEKELEELMRMYKGKGGLAFDISQRYSSHSSATRIINFGLKKICNDVGIEPITFYWARHSWATIAYNDVKEDKYVVHEALCHIAQETKITDVYIRKSWDRVWECNRKVIDFVFGEK